MFTKLRLLTMFLMSKDEVSVAECPYCGSLHVKVLHSNDIVSPAIQDNSIEHHDIGKRILCLSCGASCKSKETWVKPVFPKEV